MIPDASMGIGTSLQKFVIGNGSIYSNKLCYFVISRKTKLIIV